MILFVGQIAREMREREAFQELDYRGVRLDRQMGDRDRRSRAHPRARLARVFHRHQWMSGVGGDRAAGRHAERVRGDRRGIII